jgi:hypothetical protein
VRWEDPRLMGKGEKKIRRCWQKSHERLVHIIWCSNIYFIQKQQPMTEKIF